VKSRPRFGSSSSLPQPRNQPAVDMLGVPGISFQILL
jgi:hypothetical protein